MYALHVACCAPQSLVQTASFQHILRISNNNVNGKDKIAFAITGVPGIGRRFAALMCKKADIDLNKRCALVRHRLAQRVLRCCDLEGMCIFVVDDVVLFPMRAVPV